MDIDIVEEEAKMQSPFDPLAEISADKTIPSQFLKQTDISTQRDTTSTSRLGIKKDTRM